MITVRFQSGFSVQYNAAWYTVADAHGRKIIYDNLNAYR